MKKDFPKLNCVYIFVWLYDTLWNCRLRDYFFFDIWRERYSLLNFKYSHSQTFLREHDAASASKVHRLC